MQKKLDVQTLEDFFYTSNEAFIVVDRDGLLVEANDSLCQWLGYTRDEIIQTHWHGVVHPEDHLKTQHAVEHLGRKNKLYQFSNRYLTKSGDVVHITWSCTASSDGERLYACGRNKNSTRIGTNYSTELFFEVTLDGKLANYNGAFMKAFSLDNFNSTSTIYDQLSNGEILFDAKESLLKSKEETLTFEYYTPNRDRWYEAIAYRLEGGFGFVLKDIRTYQNAVRDAKTQFEYFKAISDATNDAIWHWDRQADKIIWSSGYEKLFGYKPEEDNLNDWLEKIHPDDVDRVSATYNAATAAGGFWQDEYRFLRKDGTWAFVIDRANIIKDSNGNTLHALGGMTDHTREFQAQQQLQEFKDLIDRSADCIITLNPDFTIRYLNQGAKNIFGINSQNVVGDPLMNLFNTENWNKIQQAITATPHGEQVQLELTLKRSSKISILNCRLDFRYHNGEKANILVFHIQDETEKHQLQQKAFRDQRLQSLGILSGGVAHDLNNILAPILLSSETLFEEIEDARLKRLAENIMKNIERASETINRILIFSRGKIESGTLFYLQENVREIHKIAAETFPKTIEVFYHEKVTEPLPLKGNPSLIEQCILNLCINARDAVSPIGQIDISIDKLHDMESCPHKSFLDPSQSYCVLSVKDDGCGIPEEIKPRVFEPFFSTKDVGEGTGLGLSSCHAIVKNHKGHLTFESEYGYGTEFFIYLPIDEALQNSLQPPSTSVEPQPTGQTILIVEDEENLRSLLSESLEAKGYKTVEAANGLEALHLYIEQQDQIDLVITDMMMPMMDGGALIHEIRQIDPDIPVILMSGNTHDNLPNNTKMMSKPFKAHQLIKEVSLHMTTSNS